MDGTVPEKRRGLRGGGKAGGCEQGPPGLGQPIIWNGLPSQRGRKPCWPTVPLQFSEYTVKKISPAGGWLDTDAVLAEQRFSPEAIALAQGSQSRFLTEKKPCRNNRRAFLVRYVSCAVCRYQRTRPVLRRTAKVNPRRRRSRIAAHSRHLRNRFSTQESADRAEPQALPG